MGKKRPLSKKCILKSHGPRFTSFTYNSNEVRTVEENGEIWFIAKDACDVLGHSNYRVATQALDDDEKDVRKVYVTRGEQDMTIINESGFTLSFFEAINRKLKCLVGGGVRKFFP